MQLISDHWDIIFSGIGTAILVFLLGVLLNKKWKPRLQNKEVSQISKADHNSKIVQAGRDYFEHSSQLRDLDNSSEISRITQCADAENGAVIVQAGRDAILKLEKSPPDIQLVRLLIEDVDDDGCLRQKINIILKNNGDKTAFLERGIFTSDAKEEIKDCSQIGMKFSLSISDWTYDINIDEKMSEFIGQHSIAPNEVVNFDVLVGRESGGHSLTIYRTYLRLEFDEGEALESGAFFLRISGPTTWNGGYQAEGPTEEQWGKCQADNINRLAAIGYDFRPFIDEASKKYIEAVQPGIFSEMSR